MKHRFLYIMALLLTVATGAWAQDPDPIDLTPSADRTVWTLSTMPEYDVELEVTYYTDEEVAEMEEAAFTEGVELTKTGANEWTLAATPAFDVEIEVEYETDLALNEVDDNTEKLDEWNGYEADVTLTRTLVKDMWNTIALPFSISSADLITLNNIFTTLGGTISFKELKSSSFADGKLTLNFADATEVEAGQPYLVKVSKNLDFATLPASIDAAIASYSLPVTNPFYGVIISKTPVTVETTAVDFIPTLGKTTIPAGETNEILFLATGNALTNPSALPSDMKGFRAYFQLKGDAATARSFALNLGDEETGIESLTPDPSRGGEGSIYSLDGRKVQNAAQKGVYIQNGKKVIIK